MPNRPGSTVELLCLVLGANNRENHTTLSLSFPCPRQLPSAYMPFYLPILSLGCLTLNLFRLRVHWSPVMRRKHTIRLDYHSTASKLLSLPHAR